MRTQLEMTLGAIAAIILAYVAVAFVIGVLVLDRWFGIRCGITLDTMFVLVFALATAAWLAGFRFQRRMTPMTYQQRTDANPVYSRVTLRLTN